MKNELEKSRKFPSKTISIAASKMFTYPTRLADAWRPDILEVNLPAYNLEKTEIEITCHQGSTNSLNIKYKNIYKRIYKKLAPPIQLDEEYIYDARYDTDGNIAHILTNVAARALMAKEICDKVTVVLRENASPMAVDVYKLLGFSVLCTNKHVQGKLIITPDIPFAYEGWYSSLFGELTFEGFDKQTPERVFISRKGTRTLINETEVEKTLEEYGFKKIYFENIPVSEQWSITKNAKVIVALHGAALSSLVFNCNALKLVELFHPGYVVKMYRHLTNAIGGTWCAVAGQLPENVIRELDFKQNTRSFALSSTKIDINSLRTALEYLGIKEA